MLVAAEGPPDKRAGATSLFHSVSLLSQAPLGTGPVLYRASCLYCFLELYLSSFGLYMNIIKS